MVGYRCVGDEPKRRDEPAGFGRSVGEQADESGPVPHHLPAGAGCPEGKTAILEVEPRTSSF